MALAVVLGALSPARLCGTSLGTQAVTVGSAASSSSVIVTTTGAWTATSNASFLHTSSSGTGNGMALFTIDQFTGASTRTGTLTIDGLNLAVTQVGTNYAAVKPVTTLVSSGLNTPRGVAVDSSGNVYVADTSNNAIEVWNAATGTLSTLVSGLGAPMGVAVDGSGNVYFADTNNNAIKVWNAATKAVTTLVSSGLQGPMGVAVDGASNVYIADTGNNAVEEWNASTKTVTSLVSSGLNYPTAVAVDGAGNVYIVDTTNRMVKEWNATTGAVSTLVSSGLSLPFGAAVDGAGNLYIADTTSKAIMKWNAATETLGTLVSRPGAPTGVAVDAAGNVYDSFAFGSVSDRIEKINIGFETLGTASLLVASAAGTGSVEVSFLPVNSTAPWTASTTDSWLHIANTSGSGGAILQFTYDANTTTTVRTGTITLDSGLTLTVTQAGTNYEQVTALTTLVSSGLTQPADVAVDGSGNVYIADSRDHAIKEWNATMQTLTTLVSSGLSMPQGVAVDGSGNVYIADYGNSAIKKWDATTNTVTTLVSSSEPSFPYGVAVDRLGNVYIADTGNAAIKEWVAATGTVTTLVSSGLLFPCGVAVDGSGNVYISETNGSRIKEWNATTKTVTTLVSTLLAAPVHISVDGSGNIYIANSDNSQIKRWNPATKTLTTLVASGLSFASGVAVDGSGNVYIADTFNNAVKELPYAFVGPASVTEPAAAGSDSLLPVLPATESLTGVFGPTSNSTWLTIGPVSSGTVSFSFEANPTGSARKANLTVLGVSIPVTQLAAQTITFGALSDEPYGTAPFTISATASSGLAVSFSSLTTSVCTVAAATVTLISAGKCTLEATQAGNSTYSPAAAVRQSFQVTQATATVTVTGGSYTYDGNSHPAITVLTGVGGAPLSDAVTVTYAPGGAAAPVDAGSYVASASFAGNTNYAPASSAVPANITINQATATVTVTGGTYTYDGNSHPAAATLKGISGTVLSDALTVTYTPGGTTAPVNAGVYSASASFAGNTNYGAASSATPATITINQATPVITWANPADITYGTPLSGTQLNATASAPAGLPSAARIGLSPRINVPASLAGSFVYLPASGAILNAGNGQKLSVSFTPTGTVNYGSAGASVSINVLKADQTITVTTHAPAAAVFGASFTVAATSSSTLPVSIAGSGGCSGSGSASAALTMTAPSTCTVSYTQAGNGNYNAAPSLTDSTTGSKAATTVTTPVYSGTLEAGSAIKFSTTLALATGAGTPTGTITFSDGLGAIGTAAVTAAGTYSFTTSSLGAGAHTITASYGGNTNFAGAQSGALQINVAPTTYTVKLTASPTAGLTAGDSTTLTVSVTPGDSGTVQFYDGSALLGSAAAAGGSANLAATLAAGGHTIQAIFTATGQSTGSNYITLWVAAAASTNPSTPAVTSTTLTALPDVSGATPKVTLTAGVSAASTGHGTPSGSVQFVDILTGAVLGSSSLSGGVATLSYTPAKSAARVITATYQGDASFATSTSAETPQIDMVNAAAYSTEPSAGQEIMTIFGRNLADSTESASVVPLPTTLGGSKVSIKDSTGAAFAGQFFYASPTQINLLIPSGMAAGAATVTVTNSAGVSYSIIVASSSAGPGLFSANATGQGVAAGQLVRVTAAGAQSLAALATYNASQKLAVAQPIDMSNTTDKLYVTLYGTGFRSANASSVTARINGVSVPVLYFGAQPAYVGLDQINLGPLPQSLRGSGTVNVEISIDGTPLNTVTLTFE